MAHSGTSPRRSLEDAQARLAAEGVDVVRIGYADLIGVDRGRDVLVEHFARTTAHGLAFCRSVFATSPRGDVVDFPGGLSDGLPDILAVPDLGTLRPVPWEPGVAHCIADLHDPDGSPAEDSPRTVLRRVCERFAEIGLTPVVGPELEFYVLERSETEASGWQRYGEGTGNIYTAGRTGDPQNVLLESLRLLGGYGIDVVAANHEFASGQFEINLWHGEALDAADRAHRFKAAVKELARRQGRLATFMPKPFNDEGGSGFHLHFSATDGEGRPAFDDPAGAHGLSDVARWAIGGVLEHTPALAAVANPTINSYKRFGPDTLAPWLVDWGLDNRSAMIRVPPERGEAARLELRLGDSSANSYLVIAGLLAAALLGIRARRDPGEPLTGYGYDESRSSRLPADLTAALDALEADAEFAELLGKRFVAAFLAYKRNEIERFRSWTTDWEFREYANHI